MDASGVSVYMKRRMAISEKSSKNTSSAGSIQAKAGKEIV
jgi:hypothetical protein